MMLSSERGENDLSPYLDFPLAEYRARLDRAQLLMREAGLDALLITQTENVTYFTGYKTWLTVSKHRPLVTVIPATGDPVLVLPMLEVGNAALFSWVKDVRLWGGADDYVAFYHQALADVGAAGGRVGVELGDDTRMGMAQYQWERLRAGTAGFRFEDATDLLWSLRQIKSPFELERMARAAQITDAAVEAAWESLRPGITEKEVARVIATAMMAGGADSPSFLIVKSGDGLTSAGNKFATDKPIRPGELVILDIGCSYGGYSSDMIRSACLGEPKPEHRRLQALAAEMAYLCRATVRAGVAISAVDAVRVAFLEEHGFPIPPYSGVGHGIGITPHELPRVGPGIDGVLKGNMVITVEPALRISPYGGVAVEDMLAVTADGHRTLTNARRELVIRPC